MSSSNSRLPIFVPELISDRTIQRIKRSDGTIELKKVNKTYKRGKFLGKLNIFLELNFNLTKNSLQIISNFTKLNHVILTVSIKQ